MKKILLENKPLVAGVGLVGVAVVAWLAFGFFGIQTAFIDNEVSEDGPVFASAAEVEPEAEAEAVAEPDVEAEPEADVVTEADEPTDEEQAEMAATEEFQVAMLEAEENATETDEPIEEVEEQMPGEIVTLFSASFSGEANYEIEGTASVLNDGTEQRFLRFEGFESSNGPDLKVYLRAENGDFVSLGELKGNIGDQNYEIPVGVDLNVFSEIQIWCERFSVNFGSANLAAV